MFSRIRNFLFIVGCFIFSKLIIILGFYIILKYEYREKFPRFAQLSDSLYISIPDSIEKIAFIYFTGDSIGIKEGSWDNWKILEIDTKDKKQFILNTNKIILAIKGAIIYYKDGSEKFVEVDKLKNYIEIKGLYEPEGYFHKYKANFMEILTAFVSNWDAKWYYDIAVNGYKYDGNYRKQQNPQFFPLYPLISRLFSTITRLPIGISLVLINNLFSLLSLIIIFRLVNEIYNEDIAKKTIMLISFYPGAISLAVGYSEGLNMFLISLALYFLLVKRNYFLTSIFIGISTAVRAQSIFFSIAFLVALIILERKNIKILNFLLYALLSFSGVIFYSLFLFLKFNEPFAWYLLNRYAWGSPDLIKNLLLSSKGFLKDFLKVFYNIKILLPSNIYAIFIVIFSLTLSKFKEKTHLFIITLIVFVITIIANFTQSPDLQSCLTRLFITNFPLFIFLARFLKNELAFSFILILFSIELLLFSLLFNFNIISISFPELIYIP
jgi:Gpi18-like mannosyltransferase